MGRLEGGSAGKRGGRKQKEENEEKVLVRRRFTFFSSQPAGLGGWNGEDETGERNGDSVGRRSN